MHNQLLEYDVHQRQIKLDAMTFPEVRQAIAQITEPERTLEWLESYDRPIRDIIAHCMKYPQCLVDGVQAIINLWDYISTPQNSTVWEDVINQGVRLSQDPTLKVEILEKLNLILSKPRVPRQIRILFNQQVDSIDSNLLRPLMNMYLSTLDRLSYDLDRKIDANLLNPILKAASDLGQQDILASIYASLAYAYAARVNYDKAMYYANISYDIYECLGHEAGMANAAHARSLAHRMIRMPVIAVKDYLISLQHYRKSDETIPFDRIYLNEAGIQYELDNFEDALANYRKCMALVDDIAIHLPYHKYVYAKCLNGIALCLVWLGGFEEAVQKLSLAYDICVELDLKSLLTNNVYIRGFLEGRRENFSKSEMYLKRALQMANELEEESVRVDLQNSISGTLKKLYETGGGSKLHNTIRR